MHLSQIIGSHTFDAGMSLLGSICTVCAQTVKSVVVSRVMNQTCVHEKLAVLTKTARQKEYRLTVFATLEFEQVAPRRFLTSVEGCIHAGFHNAHCHGLNCR